MSPEELKTAYPEYYVAQNNDSPESVKPTAQSVNSSSPLVSKGIWGRKKDKTESDGVWHAHLFGCVMNPFKTMLAVFFPCLFWPRTARRMRMGHFNFVFLLYGIPFAFFAASWYVWFTGAPILGYNFNSIEYVVMGCSGGCLVVIAAAYRFKLRSLYDIEGNVVFDALSHLLCHPCAMVQESRELDYLEDSGVALV